MNQEKGKNTMTKQMELGGTFTLPGTGFSLHRMGYGAMQLSGPEILALRATSMLQLRFSVRRLLLA